MSADTTANKISSSESSGGKSGEKTVDLKTKRTTHVVKVENFAKCSVKIQKLANSDRIPELIDLSPYDETSVRTLVKYIRNCEQKNIVLSYYALADLIDLARSLLMLGLLGQLEQLLISAASQSVTSLIQSLIIVGGDRAIGGGLGSRKKIEGIAALRFHKLVAHEDFGSIPVIVFASILGRCDLNVKSEMEVADAALLWLGQQQQRLMCCQVVMSRIRSAFLSPGDRSAIRDRIKTLQYGDKLAPLAISTLQSSNCRRCCFIREHIEGKNIRCGVPTPNFDTNADLDKLPLSAPKPQTNRSPPKSKKCGKNGSSKIYTSSRSSKKSKNSSKSRSVKSGKHSKRSASGTTKEKIKKGKKCKSSKSRSKKKRSKDLSNEKLRTTKKFNYLAKGFAEFGSKEIV